MKIMLSISPFYCRGLIYQARPRVIHQLVLMNRPGDSHTGLMNQTPTIEFLLRGYKKFAWHLLFYQLILVSNYGYIYSM